MLKGFCSIGFVVNEDVLPDEPAPTTELLLLVLAESPLKLASEAIRYTPNSCLSVSILGM